MTLTPLESSDLRRTADVFLVTAAGGPGLTRGQCRAGAFTTVSRGVRSVAEPTDPAHSQAAAAVLPGREDAVLCDVSAARAWGLPLPPWIGLAADPAPVGVAVPAGAPHPARRGVRGRRLRLPVEHLAELEGLGMTTPARTWLDCAELMPIEHLVAMGDVILRRNLASIEDLERIVRWGRGRRGVVNARLAIPLLDARAESPGESIVRVHILLDGLPRPECNLDIVVDGEWLARADLAWPLQRVIVEYDGIVHLEEAQRRSDAARRNLLQEAGWLVIVLTATDLKRPWLMTNLIGSALRARTPQGPAEPRSAEWRVVAVPKAV